MPRLVEEPAQVARIVSSGAIRNDPLVCLGEWVQDKDVRDVYRLRLDLLQFPDFWLGCRFDASTRSLAVDGGRFSAQWNPEFGRCTHREFKVEIVNEVGLISCLGTRVEVRLPFCADAYESLQALAVPPPGTMYRAMPMGDEIAEWMQKAKRGDTHAQSVCCELRDATIKAIDELQADEMIKQRLCSSVPDPYWS